MTDNEKEMVATIKLSLLRAIVDLNEETLAMAIKAPKLEEPSDDCVSKQAVLEKINDWWGITSTSGEPTLCDYIRELPPVAPTRKKGEWCKQNDDYFDWYECSECGYGSEGEMQYSSEYDVRTKYCPNCGAEMGSEE